MSNNLLIVGVDPGTTAGYAVLDVKGSFVKAKSSKCLDLNNLVKEIVSEGSVIVLGTDKKKCPAVIQKLAAQTGAKIVSPRNDLFTSEKSELVKGFEVANEHELDALAAARFAYKNVAALLKKIDYSLKKKKREELSDEVKKLVITKNISISSALDLLAPAREEIKEEPVAEERKFTEESYLLLRKKHKRLIKDNKLLRRQNIQLVKSLEKLKSKQLLLQEKISRALPEEKAEEIRSFKEERLRTLHEELSKKEKMIAAVEEETKKLNSLVAELKTGVLLKKLSNLGWEEFLTKNRILNIQEGDVLLVDEPNIYSQKTLEQLKNRFNLIITKKKANKKTREDAGMVFIDGDGLGIKENKFFAVDNKELLKKEKNKVNVLTKIVEGYKEERQH